MKYRIFGKTGEKVSVLGYGNMRLPVTDDDYYKIDFQAAVKLVRHTIDNGVNIWIQAGHITALALLAAVPLLAVPASPL